MFTDSTRVRFTAGKGGNGVVAWRREKFIPKGGPSGGNGGSGASIYLEADSQMISLEAFRNKRIIKAKDGLCGSSNLKHGKSGEDLTLKVPPGTLVKDAETGEILFDFTENKQTWKICQGGRGGKGNACFKSPTHQAPNICTEGTPGQLREVELELKIIADIGLIGMPNAGKSTLLSTIAHVRVKIGAYPFTTLFPNLAYIRGENQTKTLIADIPGLIKGAHLDKGLGFAFLKHVERSAALLFVIDATGLEERDPFDDFATLRAEIGAYNPALLEKPFLVALNKIDCEEAKENVLSFRSRYAFPPDTLIEISAEYELGLDVLKDALHALAHPIDDELPQNELLLGGANTSL
jgi:GTP-binding protein